MLQQKSSKNIFSNIISSIKDFESYEQFAVDKLKNSAIYALKMLTIFSLIISMIFTLKIYSIINKIAVEINENITEIKYENGELSINSNNPIEKEYSDFMFMYVIINTSNITQEQEQNYIEKINNKENAIVFLKDKCIVKNISLNQTEYYNYQELIPSNMDIEKEYLIESIQGINLYLICLMFFVMLFFTVFIIYGINIFMYAITLALIGNLTSILLRIPLKYKAIINIVVHALTLPTVLHLLYIIINLFTGFEIKYFSIMYIGIAYVYIVTAILMIKTDLIKRQTELTKIIEEQQKIRREKNIEELNQKPDEEKDTQEKEENQQRIRKGEDE